LGGCFSSTSVSLPLDRWERDADTILAEFVGFAGLARIRWRTSVGIPEENTKPGKGKDAERTPGTHIVDSQNTR
jgi:hypothetical protein